LGVRSRVRSKSPWPLLIGVLFGCIAVAGISTSVYLVKTEGIEGIWKRKRQFIEGSNPELKPLLDDVDHHLPRGR
jgi:hypothetical protein